jgi:hypothetical protein
MQLDPRQYLSDRRRRQRKQQGYFWGIVLFLGVYFIALGVFLVIVKLPVFQAQKITIQGASTVSRDAVTNLLEASIIHTNDTITGSHDGWKALLGFKNMLIWPDALSSQTIAIIPQLAGVTIAKDYLFHTVTVTVTERQPFAVWCLMAAQKSIGGDQQCFWFDRQGIVFEKTLETQGSAAFVVHDYAQHILSLNQSILSDMFAANMISILDVLRASGVSVQEIALHDFSLQQIDVTTNHGPTLHFSLRFRATNDQIALQEILAKPGFNKLQYIDFTVENRAYYK